MRYLYYCNSTYQLLNAINLHYNRLFNNYENINNYEGDVLLLDVFDGAIEISNILKDNKVFSNVFIGNRVYKQGKFHIIENILDIVFPSRFIYKANKIKKEKLKNKYDYIVVPKFSTITAAIWSMNRKAKLHLYEDGIGAYHTSLLDPNSKSYKIFYKLFNYGRTFYDYEYLYFNKPSLYLGKDTKKIKQMPILDSNIQSRIKILFGNYMFNNSEKKIMWFDQYIDDEINEVSKNILEEYNNDVLYCTHPRHPKELKEFDKPNNYIWEIACLGIKDINNKCLLTIHSTAAFTPKLLYDYEPYIIFTVKLLSAYRNKEKDPIEKYKVIEDFKKTYSDPSKIMVPETIEEYKGLIANFINNK